MHIGRLVERFLREVDMPPTTFGRRAINDPRFVRDLRNGREPRRRTGERIIAFIESERAQRDAA